MLNAAAVHRPGLWWRLVGHRLPWRQGIPPWEREYGRDRCIAQVRRNDIVIGHHAMDSCAATTYIGVSRRDCLYGLVTGRLRFEVQHMNDPEWREPTEAAALAEKVVGEHPGEIGVTFAEGPRRDAALASATHDPRAACSPLNTTIQIHDATGCAPGPGLAFGGSTP